MLENNFSFKSSPADSYQMDVANDSWFWPTNSDLFTFLAMSIEANGRLRVATVSLLDSTGTALNSHMLPSTLDLSRFQQKSFSVNYFDGDWSAHFDGSIDSLELVRDVPEPASGGLLFAGLGLLLGVRRFSSRKVS